MRVAWAASADATDLDTEGPLLRAAARSIGLHESVAIWDDESVDWSVFDLVVIRATWDYWRRPAAFLDWCERVSAATRLRNDLDVIRWNIDKRYLADLDAAGLPVVSSTFVSPDDALVLDLSELGEVVVKPTVSAGSNDTLRLDDPDQIEAAIGRLTASGRTAMVQPYVASVDRRGERGIVAIDGAVSHTFLKGPLLEPGGGADVDGLFAREHIELVTPSAPELELAGATLEWIADRFGPQLYARVDLVEDVDGPKILEVELIEPGLFFQIDPPAAARFAAAVRSRGAG